MITKCLRIIILFSLIGNLDALAQRKLSDNTRNKENVANFEVGYIYTNNYEPVIVMQNLDRNKPGYNYNCAGYALLDGKYWVHGPHDVDNLLTEYKQIQRSELQPGDIITYSIIPTDKDRMNFDYYKDLMIAHVAKVKSAEDDGTVITTSKFYDEPEVKERTLETEYPSAVETTFWRKNVEDITISSEVEKSIKEVETKYPTR